MECLKFDNFFSIWYSVGMVKQPAMETSEFTMSHEDFPALPGAPPSGAVANSHDGVTSQSVIGSHRGYFCNCYKNMAHITEEKFNHQSHDGGKGGHFCHCDGKSINLQSTRGVPLVGQLYLYLINYLNSLCSGFTIGIIVLTLGQI